MASEVSSDFYDNLDLKYPEIGIAIDDIDRMNPGKVRFIIPVLTPGLSTTQASDNTIYQQDKTNLQNASNVKLEVENLKVSNYITIGIPKELCVLPGGKYDVTEGTINLSGGTEQINSANISGTGGVYPSDISVGSISVSGSVTNGKLTLNESGVKGWINITPQDRIIKKGSKWIISFIGGDITNPQVIGRYYDEDYK